MVLNVVVIEAKGLEAKDINGYSDPYCMLGICPLKNIQGEASIVEGSRGKFKGNSLESAKKKK